MLRSLLPLAISFAASLVYFCSAFSFSIWLLISSSTAFFAASLNCSILEMASA